MAGRGRRLLLRRDLPGPPRRQPRRRRRFTFHGRKGITAGEGGALTTDHDDIADHARKTHNFGIERALSRAGTTGLPVPEFDEIGYNYKLSDVSAAIMLAQLDRLPTW